MSAHLPEEDIQHVLNEALLQKASQVIKERATLRERLEMLEAGRQGISSLVYERVKDDYTSRLKQLNDHLNSLQKELLEEERVLVEKKIRIQAALARHQEAIEESALRHRLGEYSAERHQEINQEEGREIQRLEDALEEIGEAIGRHQELTETEEAPAQPKTPMAPDASKDPRKKTALLPEEVSDSVTQRAAPSVSDSGTDRIPIDTLPSQPKRPPQIQVYENGRVVQSVPINKTIQIGRSPSNDIVLKEAKVSRQHAEIQMAGGKYILLDLESSNGTFVAGKKVTEQVLQFNDEILIGSTKMVFSQ